MVPNFGMLSRHSLSNSNNMASNAWSTLSNLVDQQNTRVLA